MSEPHKAQEWSLAGDSLRTAALIMLVFGLAIALDRGSNELVDLGYMELSGLDYFCLQAVSKVAKVCESVAIIAIIIKHTVAILGMAFRQICDVMRKALDAWKGLKA